MPRPCSVCSSQSRTRVEAALSEGGTFTSVSRESRFSELTPDAVERHWKNHVLPEVRDARWAEGVGILSIAERMSLLATDASAIRRRAIDDGNGRLALQAIKLEGDLLTRLVDRLGVESDAAEDAFREAEAILKLVAHIARQSPRVGDWMADQLSTEQTQLAEAIRGIAYAARDASFEHVQKDDFL